MNDVSSAGFSDVCASLASVMHAEPGSILRALYQNHNADDRRRIEIYDFRLSFDGSLNGHYVCEVCRPD